MTDSSSTGSNMPEAMREALSLDGDPTRLAEFYDQWANVYDADVGAEDYGLPTSMMATLAAARQRLADAAPDLDADVLDAGCGTGLVGQALHRAGYRTIHGIDLSEGMVTAAQKTGVYATLEAGIDLTQEPPERWRQSADVVTVGGVFTVGHLPPESLRNLAMLTRPGGLLIVSTRRAYENDSGFAAVSDALADEGLFTMVVHEPDLPYTMDSTGIYRGYHVH